LKHKKIELENHGITHLKIFLQKLIFTFCISKKTYINLLTKNYESPDFVSIKSIATQWLKEVSRLFVAAAQLEIMHSGFVTQA